MKALKHAHEQMHLNTLGSINSSENGSRREALIDLFMKGIEHIREAFMDTSRRQLNMNGTAP